MKKHFLSKFFLITVFLVLALAFIVKFGGPPLLRSYIEAGIGTCETIPILCMAPQGTIINPPVTEICLISLLPANDLPKLSICVPKNFTVVQEKVTKIYYKKRNKKQKLYDNVIYLLYEKPGFFTGLFPQLKPLGITDDYEFIKRAMFAKTSNVNTLVDAFFVIIKGIFIPDMGKQENVKMSQFTIQDKYGFINYNLAKSDNYFDCNFFNKEGEYFKIYIRDKDAKLNLETIFAIISTAKKAEGANQVK